MKAGLLRIAVVSGPSLANEPVVEGTVTISWRVHKRMPSLSPE